jgi:FtsH-binding integral membrane protein
MSKTSLQKGKKFLKQAIIVMTMVAAGLALFHFGTAFAQEDISRTAPELVGTWTGGQTGLRGLILTIVNYILGFLGVVAVIMIIYGGMLYVTAAGAQEKIDKGKKILMYTVVGIVIIMLSFVIVNAVLGSAQGEAQ